MRVLNTARILAHAKSQYAAGELNVDYDTPQGVTIGVELTDKADAEEFVAQFPKSLGWRATTLSTDEGLFGYASFSVKLSKDGVRGDKNETGIKRYRRATELLEKAGVPIVWADYNPRSNQYPDRGTFESAL